MSAEDSSEENYCCTAAALADYSTYSGKMDRWAKMYLLVGLALGDGSCTMQSTEFVLQRIALIISVVGTACKSMIR